jgi:hypothetical protein
MAEVLLEIAQNASIRGMRVDGVDLFSVYDFIKYVCPGHNSIYAPTVWYRLISNDSNKVTDVLPEWQNLKFKGKGQKNTPCMAILGLQKMLLILGSKAAVEFRDRVLECFNRVIAGDHTLIREIKANAVQDGPVQQIARAALADQAAGDRAAIEAVGEHTALTGELVDLELDERRFELKRKTEDWGQSLKERGQSLKERQMSLEWRRLELADGLMESLQGLDPDWRADTRLQLHAKDLLCSTHIESRHTVQKIEHAQALDAQRGTVWRGKKCPHGKRAYRCTDKKCVRYRLDRDTRRAEQDD